MFFSLQIDSRKRPCEQFRSRMAFLRDRGLYSFFQTRFKSSAKYKMRDRTRRVLVVRLGLGRNYVGKASPLKILLGRIKRKK